jgi:aminoglycoside N3'-acetyltransferase
MKLPTKMDLADAFASVDLKDGDVVYLSSQLYGIGPLQGASSREEYLAAVYNALRSVIGHRGTLVVPTFTQQVGRFGLPFVLEETESLTGIFGEYVRMNPDSVRSLHPVFSVTAIGPLAHAICAEISPVAFGIDSSFDRMVSLGAKAVCMGFEYYSGHIVSLMHHVETVFAVPYYYNKLVESAVYARGVLIDKSFVINVKYLGMECHFEFSRYINSLKQSNSIRSTTIGRGDIHAVDGRTMFETGIKLLKENMYAFLSHPPRFRRGDIPRDGPPDSTKTPSGANWAGFQIGT